MKIPMNCEAVLGLNPNGSGELLSVAGMISGCSTSEFTIDPRETPTVNGQTLVKQITFAIADDAGKNWYYSVNNMHSLCGPDNPEVAGASCGGLAALTMARRSGLIDVKPEIAAGIRQPKDAAMLQRSVVIADNMFGMVCDVVARTGGKLFLDRKVTFVPCVETSPKNGNEYDVAVHVRFTKGNTFTHTPNPDARTNLAAIEGITVREPEAALDNTEPPAEEIAEMPF
jgi:hypothetical protein